MLDATAENAYDQAAGDRLDAAAKAGLDITTFTSAPVKFSGTYRFDVPPAELWPMVTQAGNIAKWFPIISGGRHEDGTADSHASCDVGSKRVCKTIGMGTLDETFLHSDPPTTSVYTVKNFMMPIKNHAAIMHLREFEPGKTELTWSQYFDYKGLVMRHMFPSMMGLFMNMGIKKLASLVGGEGGKTHTF
ncbi:MAG: SRPBCC family protein [Henriciella sp.]|nr:SRPBCC family protein [Henriciella sp.]